MKGVRKKLKIATKNPLHKMQTPKDFRKRLEQSLYDLQTDYVNHYQFWSLNKVEYNGVWHEQRIFKRDKKSKTRGTY